jgi:hypothetical protein
MKVRFPATHRAPTRPSTRRGGSVPAPPASAAMMESQSRPAPCWRRSGSNHSARNDESAWPDAPPPASQRMWPGHARTRPAAAVQDRRDAYGRMKRPSAMPASATPVARLIELSSETNSSIRAAAAGLAARCPNSQRRRLQKENRQQALTPSYRIAPLFRPATSLAFGEREDWLLPATAFRGPRPRSAGHGNHFHPVAGATWSWRSCYVIM